MQKTHSLTIVLSKKTYEELKKEKIAFGESFNFFIETLLYNWKLTEKILLIKNSPVFLDKKKLELIEKIINKENSINKELKLIEKSEARKNDKMFNLPAP